MAIVNAEPQLGELAPDFALEAHSGETVSLSEYRGSRRVVLFFVRAYTCYTCRQHVQGLGRIADQLKAAGTDILVILHADIEQARSYAQINNAPFPILADPSHSVYNLYGLDKILVLATRTASLVIEPNGAVSYTKSANNPWGWRNEVDNLLAHLQTPPRF